MPCKKPENKTFDLAFRDTAEFYAVAVPLALIAGIAIATLSMVLFP
jgi:hypothetical protein